MDGALPQGCRDRNGLWWHILVWIKDINHFSEIGLGISLIWYNETAVVKNVFGKED